MAILSTPQRVSTRIASAKSPSTCWKSRLAAVRPHPDIAAMSSMAQGGSANHPPLVVVGSVNADLVLQVDRIPGAGETLSASSLSRFPGGKGANQAAAAARLGYPTWFVGQVGRDANATMLRDSLRDSNVDFTHLRQVEGPSGTAVISVDSTGENCIVIVGGANTADWEFSSQAQELLEGAGALLLQREIPEDINIRAAKMARRGGATVVLDCGGDDADISAQLLQAVTVLSPNETELARLTGLPTGSDAEVERAAKALLGRGVDQVLVKLGSKGSMLVTGGQTVRQPIVSAGAVRDTTGAGDCFTAAFAVAVLEGRPAVEALRFASAAAALCVAAEGAMPSLPWRQHLDELVAK